MKRRVSKIGNIADGKIGKTSKEEVIESEYRVELDGLSASDQTHRRLKVRFSVDCFEEDLILMSYHCRIVIYN